MKKLFTLSVVLLLSGCSLWQTSPAELRQKYICGTLPLTVTRYPAQGQIRFIMDGKPLTLKRIESVSDERYSDGDYTFWSQGEGARIERNNKIIVKDCVLQSASA